MIILVIICVLIIITVAIYIWNTEPQKTQTVRVVKLEHFENIIPSQRTPDEIVIFEPEDIYYYEDIYYPDPEIDIEPALMEEVPYGSQNVHDSNIVKSTIIAESNLKDSGLAGMTFDRFKSTCDRHVKDIIESIEKRNSVVVTLGKTEYQVLLSVYESIRGDQILLDEFVFQIEDCMSNGFLVCATGVVTRLLSVHLVKCTEKPLLTENLIREILLSRAGVLQSEGMEYDDIPVTLETEYPDYDDIIKKIFHQSP